MLSAHIADPYRARFALAFKPASPLSPNNKRCSPPQRGRLLVAAGAPISSNEIRPGVSVEVDNAPYRVIEFLHVKPGKGAAFVRSKLRNYITGGVVEKTFRAGEMLQTPDLVRKAGQFTYAEGEDYVFMDTENYEEIRLKKDDWAKFLKEGTTCELMFYNGKVISVVPPQFMDLKVVDTGPNVKGNTTSGGSKPATLETGAVVSVPLFVENDQLIKVDTQSGQYLSKVN